MHAETVWKLLERTADHPAHAYLFTGDDREGKLATAERFAGRLLSETSPSPSFVRRGQTEPFSPYEGEMQRGLSVHPDFIRLEREEGKKELTVEQARQLIERLQLTSARGGYQVALIAQADRLNDQAANALLKIVEEPSPKTVFLFLAERAERLPATLRSRLVTLEVDRPLSARRTDDLQVPALLRTLATQPLGRQIAELESVAKRLESDDDAETQWRDFLSACMWSLDDLFASDPTAATRVGHGLIHAWRLAGTSLSPRLGLEWAAVRPYLSKERSYPSFLEPTYL